MRQVVGDALTGPGVEAPRVPGSTPSHYAPDTPMTLVPAGEIDARAAEASRDGQRIAVLAHRLPLKSHEYVTWINAGKRPAQYAHDLYANLRALYSSLRADSRAGRAGDER